MKNLFLIRYIINRIHTKPMLLTILFIITLQFNVVAMELVIENKKSTYSYNEQVIITATIKNNESVKINMPLLFICPNHYIRFIIKNEDGVIARNIGMIYDIVESASDIKVMNPKSIFSHEFNLKKHYNLPPGKYSAIAFYRVDKYRRTEEHIWTGELESNSISFEIIEKNVKKRVPK